MNKNLAAFLHMIGTSEGTVQIPNSDSGYKVIVGGKLFTDYSDHPRKVVYIKRIKDYSTAAGRYQILVRYYDYYKRALDLPDFSPASQDKIALQLIKECGAYHDILGGRIETAIKKCKSRWASFDGAGYGQLEHKAEVLIAAYTQAGGVLA
jgi:muramidase (phage lysozyme)